MVGRLLCIVCQQLISRAIFVEQIVCTDTTQTYLCCEWCTGSPLGNAADYSLFIKCYLQHVCHFCFVFCGMLSYTSTMSCTNACGMNSCSLPVRTTMITASGCFIKNIRVERILQRPCIGESFWQLADRVLSTSRDVKFMMYKTLQKLYWLSNNLLGSTPQLKRASPCWTVGFLASSRHHVTIWALQLAAYLNACRLDYFSTKHFGANKMSGDQEQWEM